MDGMGSADLLQRNMLSQVGAKRTKGHSIDNNDGAFEIPDNQKKALIASKK